MRYTTTYDVGDRKRSDNGINEDSIAATVLEDGHREGYSPPDVDLESLVGDTGEEPTGHGACDAHKPSQEQSDAEQHAAEQSDRAAEETQAFETENRRQAKPRNRDAGIFVLADGAGGEQAGDIASYIATTVITEELSGIVHRARRQRTDGFALDIDADFGEPVTDDNLEEAIVDAVAAANQAIIEYAQEANLSGIYTTIVVGVSLGGRLYYGWIGDSRIYVINTRHQEITALTKDHAKVTRWEEEGRIDEVEAHVHPEGNEINSALGGSSDMTTTEAAERVRQDIETRSVQLFREDNILLTSDGLIDAQTDAIDLYKEYIGSDKDEEVAEKVLAAVVTDDLLRDVVLEAETLEQSADRFVTLSNEKGGKDNISIIMFADETLPRSPDPDTSTLPERSVDPPEPLEDRETVIQ